LFEIKDSIFIFDLHNTLYDEVLEYGGAMASAISFIQAEAERQGIRIETSQLCSEISQAHTLLGSDWDDDVWQNLSCLQEISGRNEIIERAIKLRLQVSEALTKKYAYSETISMLHDLKRQGARLFIATEATENAAAHAAKWLELDGIIEATYSWPYQKAYTPLKKTRQKTFPFHPEDECFFLQKPHPFILAEIILDISKTNKEIAENVNLKDVFEIELDETIDISELLSKISDDNMQAIQTVNAIRSKLKLKDTAYKTILNTIRKRCFYVGDSFFKDGFLAHNANVPFIHASYGKKILNPTEYEQAKEILYQVTGWESFLLQLTQEAGKLPHLANYIKPFFTCEQSLKNLSF